MKSALRRKLRFKKNKRQIITVGAWKGPTMQFTYESMIDRFSLSPSYMYICSKKSGIHVALSKYVDVQQM
jgi:hypothetical protein